MKNKIAVTIAGREYTMVAVEDEGYVRRCAAHVDEQLRPILAGRLSQADGAVLAAMNDSLDEIARLKDELSQTKRELFKAQNRKN